MSKFALHMEIFFALFENQVQTSSDQQQCSIVLNDIVRFCL